MKPVFKPDLSRIATDSVERILGHYYPKLVEWSRILARGDETAAGETVQDLCLSLTVTQPDLRRVRDIESYLFMCLRNMYISNLARVSRERLRVIQVEDYDALEMVASGRGLETVEIQNELIQICAYVVSRKYLVKSASQFILHFFLGYKRSDVAVLARAPIAAIYNGLKECRAELRASLSAGEGIRVISRGVAPQPELLRTAIPSDVLLRRLRSAVLDSDPQSCSAEQELVDAYKHSSVLAVECRQLAHLAGCQRCLEILERILKLDDRDGPLDGLDTEPSERIETRGFDAMMRLTHRRRQQLSERRPTLLAIAVDGRVVAYHAVESVHNSLSSRVDTAVTAQFIEVFNEYGDRMAHIPLEAGGSATARDLLSQRVPLSDDRWLSLEVHYDGLGIHAEVEYTDPALASADEREQPSHARPVTLSFWERISRSGRFGFAPWGVVTFASFLMAAIVGVAGYRYLHPGWQSVLARTQAAVQMPSTNQAVHQILRVEQITSAGQNSLLGSIDIWHSSDKKIVRRLYNAENQLVATSTESEYGPGSMHIENGVALSEKDRQFVESGIWRTDVSAAAFIADQGAETEAIRNIGGFEVTRREDGHSAILLRTLVLDRSYQVKAEKVRFKTTDGVVEVRLVQTLLRNVPDSEVPPLILPQSRGTTAPGLGNGHSARPTFGRRRSEEANLEVAVLYELFELNADTGQPIEVSPTAGGRIRMTGTLGDTRLLEAIREKVAKLPQADDVDFQIYSTRAAASSARRGGAIRQELGGTSGDAPAAGLVRDALLARGLKGAALQSAEQEFSTSVLTHAQTALQHAYALDRLGAILRRDDESLAPDARVRWAKMVQGHSVSVVTEFDVLRLQLRPISAGIVEVPHTGAGEISDASTFVRTAAELRSKAQAVNEQVVKLFAGSAADLSATQLHESLARLCANLPLIEANYMEAFANRLSLEDPSRRDDLGELHTK